MQKAFVQNGYRLCILLDWSDLCIYIYAFNKINLFLVHTTNKQYTNLMCVFFLFDHYLPTYPRYRSATYVRICIYIVQRNVTTFTVRMITAYTCR